MSIRSLVLACVVSLTTASWALAWNDYGHQLSAAIAWQVMTPEARAKATAILKAHPQYDLLSERCPKTFDADQFVFMKAATWPDMVRDRKNSLQQTEHKGPWHYINIPIELGSIKGPQPKFDWRADTEPENLVQALAKCEADLKDAKLSDEEKAKRLCWVLHLVGDIHQPLHAVSLFSQQFPQGDKGGNLFFVGVSGNPEKLHGLWDDMLGRSRDAAAIDARARKLRENPEYSAAKLGSDLKRTSAADWAKESAIIARRDVYLDGKLKGAKGGKDADQPGEVVPPLPEDYRRNSEPIAERQIVRAGWTMARRVDGVNSSLPFTKPDR